MTEHEPEQEQSERPGEPPVSEPAAAPVPLQSLAAAIGNRSFSAGVAKAKTGAPREGPGDARLSLHQLLRDAVEVELGGRLEAKPRVGRTKGPALQRVAPQGSMISQLAQLSFAGERATGGAIRNPRRVIEALSGAVASAWSTWQSTATMVGVVINGPTATAGQLIGPPLQPLILAGAPMGTPAEIKLSNAVATAFGTAFLSWQAKVKFVGQPLYPAFAAIPSPVAPPTPNVPLPLAAVSMIPMTEVGPWMAAMLADPADKAANAICTSLGSAIDKAFHIWLVSTMVTNIMGTGPVPTFAPPYVPVGPVVGGVGTMTPGGLI